MKNNFNQKRENFMQRLDNDKSNKGAVIKYMLIAGAVILIAFDANAAWDLSKQIGDSIITPVAKAFKDWVSVIIGIAAGGGLALGTQGDLRERSKVAGIGFLGGYGVIEVIKAMSGI